MPQSAPNWIFETLANFLKFLPKMIMDSSLFLLATALNNLLSKQLSVSEISIRFYSIAEELRSQNLKVQLIESTNRDFQTELYWALERKNMSAYQVDFKESERLHNRFITLLAKKKFQEDRNASQGQGNFYIENFVSRGYC